MALAVNAYNLKRAINVLGVRQMMALMAEGPFFVCCEHKSKHPDQVGAFVGTAISAFSHSLVWRVFEF
jgi:hypothetical protein